MGFAHLHLHTDFSLLDGSCKVKSLIKDVKKSGMKAVAITDHGNMFGAVDFYKAAKSEGIIPIIGMESYIAPRSRHERKNATRSKEASFHLPILAYSTKGYHNLVKLSSLAYIEGFYYKPRIDKELLEQYHEGIIGLSGCLAGEVCQNILNDRFDKAVKTCEYYRDLFGKDNYFIEIMHNGLDIQEKANESLIKIARKLNIPIVATNDVHYLTKVDANSHDCLLCIQTGRKKDETKRFKFPSDQFYLKSEDEMRKEFAHVPEIFDNIQSIIDRIDIDIEFNNYHLPTYDCPNGLSEAEYMEQLTLEGLKNRYGELTDVHLDRMAHELKIIRDMGFPSYFLIVWDFIKYARDNGIPVGPGRGSGAGSIVAYAMTITDIDPLKYDLIFERFLNPARNSMPDFDIDFCQERRQEVIDYVYRKYGKNAVSQIITFGTMGAKGVLRDVGRTLDIPLPQIDKIAKLIPTQLNITLTEALEQEKELGQLREADPKVDELFEIALSLEGQCRHSSTHAAGVVISDKPIYEYVPMFKSKDGLATQYTMSTVEECGLLKMDFLGLQTLTVIQKALDLIEKNHNLKMMSIDIPIDDKATFEMMDKSETIGVFQLESSGFREVIGRLKPDRFEDIIALVAMYRPGPLESGMVDTYIDVKNGVKEAAYDHPMLLEMLEETYGVILYQEQVMRIANVLANFSLAESDNLRKAMGKKKPEIMAKFRSKFIEGAKENNIDEEKSGHIYDNIEKFAGYGFNKSHSAAYALIAYHTAYLKCHYPEEFMSALMTCDISNTDKLVNYLEECKRLGFSIHPPDVNFSDWGFTPTPKNIRFGLGAIKGIGKGPVEAIVEGRLKKPYKSIFDFCEKVNLKKVGRSAIETINNTGGFASFELYRSQIAQIIPNAVESASASQKDKATGQASLFGDEDENETLNANEIPSINEWDDEVLLNHEKESLGLYITGHPIGKYVELVKKYTSKRIIDIPEWINSLPAPSEKQKYKKKPEAMIGGMLSAIKVLTTRKTGAKMAIFQFEDLESSISCVVFPKQYEALKDLIEDGKIVFIKGEVDNSREEIQMIVNEIIPIAKVQEMFTNQLILKPKNYHLFAEKLDELKSLMKKHSGECPIMIKIPNISSLNFTLQTAKIYKVKPSKELEDEIIKMVPDLEFEFSNN